MKFRNKIAATVSAIFVILGLAVAPAAFAGAPYSCTTSASNGECGPYTYPAIQGTNSGNENKNLVGNNMFVTGSQTLFANNTGDWKITANWPAGNTGVESYPSLDADYHELINGTWVERPLSDFGYMVSSFNETMTKTSGTSGWAAYDIWLDHGTYEVMVQHDFANNGFCNTLATATFGGSNGVPIQQWHLCTFGSELIWKLGTDDNNKVNEQSGSIDMKGMINWLVDHGYVTANPTIGDIGYGWELASTGGINQDFVVSGFSISVGAVGSPQAPVVMTNAATGVTTSAATLNGTVNPENQATTYHFEYGTTTGYGTNVPIPDGSAGAGNAAVAESANLTGLAANTAYHYRLDATNATGTTAGSDQTFTTSATAGTVGFGVTSAAHACANCLSTSWTHTVSGANPALLVEAAVGWDSCTLNATDNGVAMSRLSTVHDNGQPQGYHSVFGKAAPVAGANNIVVSVTGCTSTNELTGGSLSFNGASQSSPFGTPVTTVGAGTTPSATIASASGDMIAGFVSNGSSIISAASPATSRYIANQDNNSGAGNSAGATALATGSNVTIGWNVTNDWWGVTLVQIQHS